MTGFTMIQGDPLILLLFVILGLLVGAISGALPGMSVLTAVVVFLPITYTMSVENAITFLVAMYAGGTYGGSTLAILLNIPGGPENACSAIDGYSLTRKGLAARAVVVAILSSGIGALFGSIVLMTLSPLLATVALDVNPAQVFAIIFFALCAAGVFDGASPRRAYLAALAGVVVATIGLAPMHGVSRFTFGAHILDSGIDFVAVIIGALALSEVFVRLYKKEQDTEAAVPTDSDQQLGRLRLPDRKTAKSLVPVWARNSVIGGAIGILPGAGATAASFIAYSTEKRINKRGAKFGTGEYAGVAAPESANNSAAMTSLVPLLTLGIPGGAVAAVLYGVFTIHGLQPGPLLAQTQPDLLATIYAAAIVSSVLILVIGVFEAHNTVRILKVPESFLLPSVVAFAVIGSYSLNNNIFDVWVTVAFGLIGAFMRLNGYSVVAFTLGVILGPIMENSFSIGARSEGTYFFFLQDVGAVAFVALGLGLVLYGPLISRVRKRHISVIQDTAVVDSNREEDDATNIPPN